MNSEHEKSLEKVRDAESALRAARSATRKATKALIDLVEDELKATRDNQLAVNNAASAYASSGLAGSHSYEWLRLSTRAASLEQRLDKLKSWENSK